VDDQPTAAGGTLLLLLRGDRRSLFATQQKPAKVLPEGEAIVQTWEKTIKF
jgi:hypothetical protein